LGEIHVAADDRLAGKTASVMLDQPPESPANCIGSRINDPLCDELVDAGSEIVVDPCDKLCNALSIA